jgi:hypothetical protein
VSVGVEAEIKITDREPWPAITPYATSVYRSGVARLVKRAILKRHLGGRGGQTGVIAARLQTECGTTHDMLPLPTATALCISGLKT